VPALTCTIGGQAVTAYSSAWIGIDGDGSQTVEQDGTEQDCDDGTPDYYAWYEMYGDNSVDDGYAVPLSKTVKAGDAMTASVSYSGERWTLSISDSTESWTYSKQIAEPTQNVPAQASAEWIVELPQIDGDDSNPLADFGTARFTSATATVSTGSGTSTGPASEWNSGAIDMVNSGLTDVMAATYAFDDTGEDFSDIWENSD